MAPCRRLVWFATLFTLCLATRQTIAQRDVLRDLAQRVKPSGAGAPERLSHYIRCFRDATFQDPRVFAFQVETRVADDGVIELTGAIEFPEMRDALLVYLRLLGFQQLRDSIELLPSDRLGAQRFGFVTASHSLVLMQPVDGAETATDALLGEPLFLLKEAGQDFLLCHTGEGYLGYIRSRDVVRVDADSFHRQQAGKQVRLSKPIDERQCGALPTGSRLRWISRDGDQITASLPDGRQAMIPIDSATVFDQTCSPHLQRILTAAQQFLDVEYLWGGKTRAGVDCSGLVQTAFAAGGIHLARDSNQQVLVGQLTATRWYRQGLRRGDTLYFLGRPGKITHTGIYLGHDQYIEAVTPVVRISSLNPDDDNYSRRGDATFTFAKRLLD